MRFARYPPIHLVEAVACMVLRDSFWFVAGAMTMFAALLIGRALWRDRAVSYGTGIAGAVAFIATALGAYLYLGSPDTNAFAADDASGKRVGPHPANMATGATQPGSMTDVANKLAARLAAGGGTRQEWLLLAQSYELMGKSDEAQSAREQAAVASSSATAAVWEGTGSRSDVIPAAATGLLPNISGRTPHVGGDLVIPQPDLSPADEQQLSQAEQLRRARNFAGAHEIYTSLAKRNALTADAWADYADVGASLNDGSLSGEPAKAIDASLQIDPRQPKALWLKASLAHEERRYSDALTVWRRLDSVIPASSPDHKIIASNIEEASRLAQSERNAPKQSAIKIAAAGSASAANSPKSAATIASTATAPPLSAANTASSSKPTAGAGSATTTAQASPKAASSSTARIAGTVDLSSSLAAKAPREAILFIYAKRLDMPGPPLAVVRLQVSNWPVAFVLDDSNAMIAGHSLSSADNVKLEARISRSGNAQAQPGDLIGTLARVDPRAGNSVRIAIDREIG